MSHYSAYNLKSLAGGDLISLINAIGVMTEKMELELPEIPTSDQKEAVVMEIVQSKYRNKAVCHNFSG